MKRLVTYGIDKNEPLPPWAYGNEGDWVVDLVNGEVVEQRFFFDHKKDAYNAAKALSKANGIVRDN